VTIQLDLFGEAKVKVKEPAQVSRWNTKLGVLPSFSLPVLETCPGKTEFCSRLCYGLRGRFTHQKMREIYQTNLKAIHVVGDFYVGDFYSVEYVEKWIEIADRLPDVKFFGSTRSWRVPELRHAVERFRDLPNVHLRASVDFSHSDQPGGGWGVWTIEGEGDPCPHDYGLVKNCITCKKCWRTKDSDIRLRLKWGKPTQLSLI